MDHAFLFSAGDFLHFKIEALPLKYLGILVGDIPNHDANWHPLVNSISKRLNS